MQRIWFSWISIRQSEINGDIQINLASSKNIFKEIRRLNEVKLYNWCVLILKFQILWAILDILNRGEWATQELMISICIWFEEIYLYFLIHIIWAKIVKIWTEFIPILFASFLIFDFRFVHGFIFTWTQKFPKNEKSWSIFRELTLYLNDSSLSSLISFFLFSNNFQYSILLSWRIENVCRISLIHGSNNLM